MTAEDVQKLVHEEDGGLRRWWWIDFALPGLVLVLGTAFFWSGERDLAVLIPHFSESDGWREDAQPWRALYDHGVIPTALLTFAAIVILPLSYLLKRLHRLRAPAVFFLVVVAVGPGLITNAILKDHWNRPRPRSIEEFGGKYAFEPILRIDTSSRGKSFPCGHASAVFVLASTWLLLRERRKTRRIAWGVFVVGTVFGSLTCYARIIQGGHFASDCVWSWGIVALTSSSIYWFLRNKIYKQLLTNVLKNNQKKDSRFSTGFKITALIVGCGFFAAFLLAIPYRVTYDHSPSEEATSFPLPFKFSLKVPVGAVEVRSGQNVRWVSSASAFGYAGSRLAATWKETIEEDDSGEKMRNLSHLQKVNGFFSEITQTGKLTLPMGLLRRLKIEIEEGEVALFLPRAAELKQRSDWKLVGKPSEVLLVLSEQDVPDFEIRGLEIAPEGSEGLLRNYAPGIWRAGGIPELVIKNETVGTMFRIRREDGQTGNLQETEGDHPSIQNERSEPVLHP